MNEIIADLNQSEYRPDKYQDPRTLSEAWKTALFGPAMPKARVHNLSERTFPGAEPSTPTSVIRMQSSAADHAPAPGKRQALRSVVN